MSKGFELPNMVAFNDRCALEKALAYSIGGDKSRECVRRLLERYGSLATVFSGNEEELCRVGEINMNTALLIKLIAYVNSRRVTSDFKMGRAYTELELREFLSALFLGNAVETVYALLVDDCDRIMAVEYISDGTINSSDILPRKILECAKKKKCERVILAHNHPKGTPTPSKDDIITTGRLVNVFSTVGVKLVAHYIIADGEVGRIESEMLYNPEYGKGAF